MKKKDMTDDAPNSLVEYVNKKWAELDAAEEKRKAATLLEAQYRHRREKENLLKGLILAREIWQWAKDIRRSDLGKKLMRLSHMPTEYHLVVFWDGYGNNITDPHNRDWYSLAFAERGLIRPLYGRMFTSIKFNSANDLVKKIPIDVLEKVCIAIEDGSVWQRIEKGFLKKEAVKKAQELLKK